MKNEQFSENAHKCHVGPLRLDFSAASKPFELKLSGKPIDMLRKLKENGEQKKSEGVVICLCWERLSVNIWPQNASGVSRDDESTHVRSKVQALQRGRAPLRRAGPSATPSLRKERSDPLPEGKGHSSLRSARKAKRGTRDTKSVRAFIKQPICLFV